MGSAAARGKTSFNTRPPELERLASGMVDKEIALDEGSAITDTILATADSADDDLDGGDDIEFQSDLTSSLPKVSSAPRPPTTRTASSIGRRLAKPILHTEKSESLTQRITRAMEEKPRMVEQLLSDTAHFKPGPDDPQEPDPTPTVDDLADLDDIFSMAWQGEDVISENGDGEFETAEVASDLLVPDNVEVPESPDTVVSFIPQTPEPLNITLTPPLQPRLVSSTPEESNLGAPDEQTPDCSMIRFRGTTYLNNTTAFFEDLQPLTKFTVARSSNLLRKLAANFASISMLQALTPLRHYNLNLVKSDVVAYTAQDLQEREWVVFRFDLGPDRLLEQAMPLSKIFALL